MIANYSRVQLMTDRFRAEGVKRGNIGYIIEVYENGNYEVEFSDSNGTTIAQIVAPESELKVSEPAPLAKAG